MKKYIFTESQIKGVIDSIIINEQNNQLRLLKLNDLADLVARMGIEKETLLKMFLDVYRKEGSEGVIKLFNAATDLDLEDFGYGRFHIKH